MNKTILIKQLLKEFEKLELNESPICYGKDLENGKKVSLQKVIEQTLNGGDLKQQNSIIPLNVNEAMNNSIGVELTTDIVDDLVSKYPEKLKPLIKFEDMQARVAWLVKYVDVMDEKDLIGLKISNVSDIEYSLDGVLQKNSITLTVGNTKTDSYELDKGNLNDGLYHMKYGKNRHWNLSKEALFLIPKSLTAGVVRPAKEQYKYEIYFRKRNCIYVVGVPSPMGDATILVTCQKRENNNKPKTKRTSY